MATEFECAKDHGNGWATSADEFVPIPAFDPQQAATRFAKRYDEAGDNDFLRHGGSVIVTDGKDWWRVTVWGEGVPTYHAGSIMQKAAPPPDQSPAGE